MRGLKVVLILCGLALANGGLPPLDVASLVDSAMAQERRFYWIKCNGAMQARRRYLRCAGYGFGFFLASAGVEAIKNDAGKFRGTGPDSKVLNLPAFLLMNAALFDFTVACLSYQDYGRNRACCRYFQETRSRE